MCDINTDPRYDGYRALIHQQRKNGRLDWDRIREYGTEQELRRLTEHPTWLNPLLTPEQWRQIVDAKQHAEQTALRARELAEKAADDSILGQENNADISVAEEGPSCWQRYRARLENRGWHRHSIDSIEDMALKTLRRMNRTTLENEPVKGLVVGHVQSGKTANMAALMAIGADNGYNFFIVLSGSIESLRRQTQMRLFNDLQPNGEYEQNLVWQGLHQLNLQAAEGDRLQDKHFGQNAAGPYMTVSLKNVNRLSNLRDWLNACPDKLRQMKMVIIDDEADQAGINIADVDGDERATINNLIVSLTQVPALAVNYVSYTATPYANFLNEAYPESLYPRDFITTLPQPDEHFGSQQIFGLEGRYNATNKPIDGLDIIREVSADDLVTIKAIHDDVQNPQLPPSLKDALCWFLCAASARRHWGAISPSSMLIHTSQRVAHHQHMAEAISRWLDEETDAITACCEKLWESESKRFTPKRFREQFPEYGKIAELYNQPPKLKDYPPFQKIRNEISHMLGNITAIPLDKDQQPQFHDGIHLCIDNAANNGVDAENQIHRLIYPENPLDHSTAFIVIGGSTLSRGLTIEGLVSTYFLRNTNQMDTLMQMGRWFGYRRGYELLPRIWMTDACRDKFTYLALAEKELREELRSYMEPAAINPSEFGPRVISHYALNWMRPTARNRMQHAMPTGYDFSSANSQTTLFNTDPQVLRSNIDAADRLVISLRDPMTQRPGALIWTGIKFDRITPFLNEMQFHPRAKLFGEMPAFIQWYNTANNDGIYDDWNIVVAGINENANGIWNINGHNINKISRSRFSRNTMDRSISIGVLRTPKDLLADLQQPPKMSGHELDNITVQKMRTEQGLGETPQLLIYRISKDSRAEPGTSTRVDLGTEEDIIGISLWIPGIRNQNGHIHNFAQALQVQMPPIAVEEMDV